MTKEELLLERDELLNWISCLREDLIVVQDIYDQKIELRIVMDLNSAYIELESIEYKLNKLEE